MRVNTRLGKTKTNQQGGKVTSVNYSQTGFTIVETLIVLAVTGTLFVSVITLISGRQNKTEFNQAVNNVKNQLDQTINEVSSGFYPNANNFACTANAATGKISFPSGPGVPPNPQGTNSGCIFLGKVIHFSIAGSPSDEPYYVYSLAGSQHDAAGNVTTSLQSAGPLVVPGSTETHTLQYGLSTPANKVTANGAPIGSFAFVNSLGSYAGGDLVSGSGQVSLLPITGGNLSNDQAAEQTAIQNYFTNLPANTDDSTIVNPPSGVQICFNSGGTNQYAVITIGSNGRALSTTLKINNGVCP